ALLGSLPGQRNVPAAVWRHIERGVAGQIADTPKRSSANVQTLIIGNNRMALQAAHEHADALGYDATVVSHALSGVAREVGRDLVRHIVDRPVSQPTCYLWGGETTVNVRGSGRGGRNQELALAAALALQGVEQPCVLLSGGTDGIDGPTDAAGAYATNATILRAQRLGLDALASLDNNDAFTFFERTGGLLRIGPTHTNVMDVQVALVWP
ncbi:MAG: MOFRL family protein, partial [Bacteroidota bacterium]